MGGITTHAKGCVVTDTQSFHEPTFTAALDRAEAIIDSHDQYRPEIRRQAMRALYASVAMVTDHQPLDRELRRLSDKLDDIMDLPDEGRAVSAWDTALKRYERMRDNQYRVLEVMRKDRRL